MPLQFRRDPLPIINRGERHVPAVLLVDISGSMHGKPIQELNEGLKAFGEALQNDSLALGRAEVSIISFNTSVQTEMGFRPAGEYEAPVFTESGLTAFNAALDAGLDAIEARKAEYKKDGVSHYRPWLFALTDGAPTDIEKESAVKERLRKAIRDKKVVYMPMGIGNADIKKLQGYYPEEYDITQKIVLKANANSFKEAFVWLSSSLSAVSNSNPDVSDTISLPPLPANIEVGII